MNRKWLLGVGLFLAMCMSPMAGMSLLANALPQSHAVLVGNHRDGEKRHHHKGDHHKHNKHHHGHCHHHGEHHR